MCCNSSWWWRDRELTNWPIQTFPTRAPPRVPTIKPRPVDRVLLPIDHPKREYPHGAHGVRCAPLWRLNRPVEAGAKHSRPSDSAYPLGLRHRARDWLGARERARGRARVRDRGLVAPETRPCGTPSPPSPTPTTTSSPCGYTLTEGLKHSQR